MEHTAKRKHEQTNTTTTTITNTNTNTTTTTTAAVTSEVTLPPHYAVRSPHHHSHSHSPSTSPRVAIAINTSSPSSSPSSCFRLSNSPISTRTLPPVPTFQAGIMEIKDRTTEECCDLGQERETGNIEYKLKLVGKTMERIEHLVTQMNYRLSEGHGEAIYELGVQDNGFPEGLSDEDLSASVRTIRDMAAQLKCDVVVLRIANGAHGRVAELLVRRLPTDVLSLTDIRVAVVGNAESGKSTLVGVLTSGKLDNGRGLARMRVFRHRHEVEHGRTSSVSHQLIGFDSEGNIMSHGTAGSLSSAPLAWNDMLEESNKIITFMDLAGHEGYLKTTLGGLIGKQPDYGLVAVAANSGILRMTREHLGLALALSIPIFIVVTKIDMCSEQELQVTLDNLISILRADSEHNDPIIIRSMADITTCTAMERSRMTTPIFTLSSVTGKGLDLFKAYLYALPKQRDWTELESAPAEFSIDDTFTVDGTGTVVTGTMMAGTIMPGDRLLLGPMADVKGSFVPVQIKSVHVKRRPASRSVAGQSCSFALKTISREHLRKGMVMCHPSLNPRAVIAFDARIRILNHPNTITANYQPIVHLGTIAQAAEIVHANPGTLRTGDRAEVHMNFVFHPEYVKEGTKLVFREGRTRGVGKVLRVYYADSYDRDRHMASLSEDDTPPHKIARRRSRSRRSKSRSPFLQPTSDAVVQAMWEADAAATRDEMNQQHLIMDSEGEGEGERESKVQPMKERSLLDDMAGRKMNNNNTTSTSNTSTTITSSPAASGMSADLAALIASSTYDDDDNYEDEEFNLFDHVREERQQQQQHAHPPPRKNKEPKVPKSPTKRKNKRGKTEEQVAETYQFRESKEEQDKSGET